MEGSAQGFGRCSGFVFEMEMGSSEEIGEGDEMGLRRKGAVGSFGSGK